MRKHLRTVIIGASGRAKVITAILELNNYNIIGYVSSEPKGSIINGYPVLCSIEEMIENNNNMGFQSVIVAIGDNYQRKVITEKAKKLQLQIINCIHPDAQISKGAILGEGIYIDAGVIIHPGVVIGDNVTIGLKSTISHDSIIGDYVNIAPGVTICGEVKMNELSVAGPGAVIIEKINIGRNSIVGAGAVVVSNVDTNSVVMGVPAKCIRTRDLHKTYLK